MTDQKYTGTNIFLRRIGHPRLIEIHRDVRMGKQL